MSDEWCAKYEQTCVMFLVDLTIGIAKDQQTDNMVIYFQMKYLYGWKLSNMQPGYLISKGNKINPYCTQVNRYLYIIT